jgi:hypothetical protein
MPTNPPDPPSAETLFLLLEDLSWYEAKIVNNMRDAMLDWIIERWPGCVRRHLPVRQLYGDGQG